MDTDTIELLLAAVDTMWPERMTLVQLGNWSSALRAGLVRDPEIAGATLLELKHLSCERPSIETFLEAYGSRMNRSAGSDGEPMASAETVAATVRHCRELLSAGPKGVG